MTDYVAWLNGTSVARGTLRQVENKAREIAATSLWREWNRETTMKITRGSRQSFVKSFVLGSIPTGVL